MKPKIPFWTPEIGNEEYDLVHEVLDSNFMNDGAFTTRFEEEISSLFGVRHVVAVTSGSAALFLVMSATGIGPGDEAIVPDVTFIATANAVCMTGARPVLVDCDPNTLNMDPERIREAITDRTRAIMPVHVSGRCVDLDAIREIAADHDLLLIEDAAQALLSRRDGKCLGTFGVAGCASFSPNKTITTGQGGIIMTDDDALHVRLRELKDQGRPVRGTASDDLHPAIGYNFKYTNLQAAVGLAQLARLGERVESIRRLYRVYAEQLEGVDGIRLLGFRNEEAPQWIDAIVEDRDPLIEFLSRRGIECRRFWHALHTQPQFRRNDEDFPNSSRLIPKAMWLPSAFSLTEQDALEVCRGIREFLAC